jgi:peptidoglycan/LPS O-acetylase OafA/YrhL
MQTATKPHYPILDGLRGTAAILVVIFHLLEAYFPKYSDLPIHHGYLAVDFFFLLSGFVIGYAYDDRWTSGMSPWEFLKIRLVRLHPLVILSMILGAIGFWFDGYTNNPMHVSLLKVIVVMLIGFTMLPAPDVRGWNETHSLNGPCWSLLQEYIANIIYAFFGKRMSKIILWIIVIASAVALTSFAIWHKDVAQGWAFDQFWMAFTRMMFPFFAGLLLFRIGKLIKLPMAYFLSSLLLTVLFCMPTFKYNGLYEAACIIIAFPIIVAVGAGSQISGTWAKVCKFFGDISYPLYITHYTFIYIFTAWVSVKKPAANVVIPIAVLTFFICIAVAYLALKLYDEPIRIWLRKKFLQKKNS